MKASQYITNNEKVNYKRDDDSKGINNTTIALVINIRSLSSFPLNQENLNTNTFSKSFVIIYLTQIMSTNLANCSFNHAINRSNPSFQHYKPDFFIYITSEKYNMDKFYGIIFDTGAFKPSTAEYRQYLVYKNHVTSI